jgi:polygalacturonase
LFINDYRHETTAAHRTVLGYTPALLGLGLLPTTKTFDSQGSPFDVRNYGATGVRKDNATKAFRDAIEACTAAGGGTVQVPAGEYTVGTVQLRDNVTLHLEAGAILLASRQSADYVKDSRALVFAEGAKDIGVTGKGTIDGLARYDYDNVRGADPEIAEEQEIARRNGIEMKRYYRSREAMNIYLFVLNDCTNVQLRDISVVNAPLWTIRLNDCDRVSVLGKLSLPTHPDGYSLTGSLLQRNTILVDHRALNKLLLSN